MKKTLYVFTFFASFLLYHFFSRNVLPTHFLQQGLSYSEMILGTTLTFLGSGVLTVLFRKYNAKTVWIYALLLHFTALILIVKIKFILLYYLSSFIFGISLALFFNSYNIAHFEISKKDHIGKSSALMFSLPSLIGIVVPIMAGILIQKSIFLLLLFSFLFLLLPLYLRQKQRDFNLDYSLPDIPFKLRS